MRAIDKPKPFNLRKPEPLPWDPSIWLDILPGNGWQPYDNHIWDQMINPIPNNQPWDNHNQLPDWNQQLYQQPISIWNTLTTDIIPMSPSSTGTINNPLIYTTTNSTTNLIKEYAGLFN